MKKILCMVIPCYNEEQVLPITSMLFLNELQKLIRRELVAADSRIMFVNDGSEDETWNIIKKLSEENEHFIGISQSRNRGHQNAVLAGLMEAKQFADITISVDCDGQDDITAMESMVEKYYEGYEVVYGVRNNRDTDTWFKRNSAQIFYKFMNKMGAEIVYNHADYRLVSSRVLNEFEKFEEVNLFLRGLIPLVGFKSTNVYYSREERLAGKSHYSLKKMIELSLDGITSMSVRPLRIVTGFGVIVLSISFFLIVWAICGSIKGTVINGWTSMLCMVAFSCGVQMLSMGVIGEYIGKIYMEAKRRPRYIISERAGYNRFTKELRDKIESGKNISF